MSTTDNGNVQRSMTIGERWIEPAERCAAEALACGETGHEDSVILEWVGREAGHPVPRFLRELVLLTFRRAALDLSPIPAPVRCDMCWGTPGVACSACGA